MTPFDVNLFMTFTIFGVHSEMVDFGSGQGHSDFETGGIAALC
jgi:hypothetical protein